jgi:DnaJ-class molecular chaperone
MSKKYYLDDGTEVVNGTVIWYDSVDAPKTIVFDSSKHYIRITSFGEKLMKAGSAAGVVFLKDAYGSEENFRRGKAMSSIRRALSSLEMGQKAMDLLNEQSYVRETGIIRSELAAGLKKMEKKWTHGKSSAQPLVAATQQPAAADKCPDCGGTGKIVLLTSTKPCKSCTRPLS